MTDSNGSFKNAHLKGLDAGQFGGTILSKMLSFRRATIVLLFGVFLALTGIYLGTAQTDLGKTLFVEKGCYACHGGFDPLDEWDVDVPNADGSMVGAPIIGWDANWIKEAVHEGKFVKVNVTMELDPEAQTYSESDLSDGDLENITAYLNPNYSGGDAAAGETLYNGTCGTCHGQGDDGGAETSLAPSIRFMPFDIVLSVARTGRLPAAYSYAMPLYNNTLSNDDISAIADYLDSLDNWQPPSAR